MPVGLLAPPSVKKGIYAKRGKIITAIAINGGVLLEVKTMQKIWLVNHYAMPPEWEPRIRTVKFAQFLQQAGFDVTVIGASSMHNMASNLIQEIIIQHI